MHAKRDTTLSGLCFPEEMHFSPRVSSKPWADVSERLQRYHMTYYDKDAQGEWRRNLKATNDRILADSGEGYKSERECKADIDRVKASADAPVVKD